MRRKEKRGIYSNKILKSCEICVRYCYDCKGITTVKDQILDNKGNFVKNTRPFIKQRVGSTRPGEFVFICCNRHKKNRVITRKIRNEEYQMKRCLRYDLDEDTLLYKIDKNMNNL